MNIDDLVNPYELIVVELDPRTWYRRVHGQIDLLRSHVQGLEMQIDELVKAYETEKVATVVELDNDGHPFETLVEHRGIESTPNDLKMIFEYYFPNLLRRSTLIILFSFLEYQLNLLCELFAVTPQLKKELRDLPKKEKGIHRSKCYLKKIVCLPLEDNPNDWQEIRNIQKVRNVVAHGSDAKLVKEDVIKYVKDTTNLSLRSELHCVGDIDEVNIEKGYLTDVLDIFDSYCRELSKAIDG